MAYDRLKNDLKSAGSFFAKGAKGIAINTVKREIKRAKKSQKRKTNKYGLFITDPNNMTNF